MRRRNKSAPSTSSNQNAARGSALVTRHAVTLDTINPQSPDPTCLNRDHLSFLMATGLIPDDRIEPGMMRQTMKVMDKRWNFRQTWGWDFPMMAMTASWLGEPEKALDDRMMGARSDDLIHRENISDKLTFPDGTRHGTVLRISREELEKLKTVE